MREHTPPHGLRLITTQGEPLDPETAEWTQRMFDVPLVNAYGQTSETGATWTYPVYGVDALKPGSCGTPVPGYACAVVDDAGNPVPAGTRGNLVLTAPFPTLARTIWDDEERYRTAYFTRFSHRYTTSDEAVIDADGQIWVLGRTDDVINVAAHRISTMEIEGAAASQPGVAEVAVVGAHDTLRGTVPVAFVTLRPGADPAAGARGHGGRGRTRDRRDREARPGLCVGGAPQDTRRQDHAAASARGGRNRNCARRHRGTGRSGGGAGGVGRGHERLILSPICTTASLQFGPTSFACCCPEA